MSLSVFAGCWILLSLQASLSAAIAAALGDSNLSADEIVAVDVVGGGSRIPWVVATIDEAFGVSQQQQQQQQRSKIRRTLDGGSSVAMGAASFAAGLSFVSSINNEEIQTRIEPEKVKVKSYSRIASWLAIPQLAACCSKHRASELSLNPFLSPPYGTFFCLCLAVGSGKGFRL